MSAPYNLGDLLNRSKDSDKIALIDLSRPEGAREFSHAEIDAASRAVARGLLARGLKRGDRVAIVSANRVEFLTAYFGTMRAGLAAQLDRVQYRVRVCRCGCRRRAVAAVARRPLPGGWRQTCSAPRRGPRGGGRARARAWVVGDGRRAGGGLLPL